jgi:hypothetical protein
MSLLSEDFRDTCRPSHHEPERRAQRGSAGCGGDVGDHRASARDPVRGGLA